MGFLLYVFLAFCLWKSSDGRPVFGSMSRKDFMETRNMALRYESTLSIGGDLILSEKEKYVNEMLLMEKQKAIEEARLDKAPFLPAVHFSKSQPLIANTSIYKFIQEMPKGAVLHIHDTAMVSLDWLVGNVTYRDNLYMCQSQSTDLKFRFSDSVPSNDTDCIWEMVSSRRNASDDVQQFDQWLKSEFSLLKDFHRLPSMSENEIWGLFLSRFSVVTGMLLHEPVYRDYINRALSEFHDDNVQYMEIRILLDKTYNLDGSENGPLHTLQLYKDMADEFQRNNPTSSSGAKVIVTDIRFYNRTVIGNTISEVLKFRELYPDFLAGFDLVSQEDTGKPLLDYLPELRKPNTDDPSTLPYFFHAGETDWEGISVDENIIDAILLGTKRIGHGFAVAKHPWAMEQIKNRNIAIEVNPISNQILGLVKDLRDHPAASLVSQNFPIVISCDDPPMWGATGLSYDFYAAFMAFAGAESGLPLLKQLAMNSLQYSAMSDTEKVAAMTIWTNQWDSFIDKMAGNVTFPNTTTPLPEKDENSGNGSFTIHSLPLLIILICLSLSTEILF